MQLQEDPQQQRMWTILLKASALGLDPRHTNEKLPRRISIDMYKQLRPDRSVLIGDCAAGVPLVRSRWCHKYPPKYPSDAEAAALQYLRWLKGSGLMYKDVKEELQGATLVCQCQHGQVCHGDALIQWFAELLVDHANQS